MIVAELNIYNQLITLNAVPYMPFVWQVIVGRHTTAAFWTTTFGFAGDTSAQTVSVNSVIVNTTIYLQQVSTINNCIVTQQSFYYDFAGQNLYMHLPHSLDIRNITISYGVFIGATNGDVVRIGNEQYSPLLRSVPNVQQKQDYSQYGKLTFVSGKVSFTNVNGEFDDIITAPIYGNEINQYYLPNGKQDYERNELVPIASYWVEDYDFSISELSINVQDKRKSANAKILTEKLYAQNDTIGQPKTGDPVPLMYGQIRACNCLVDLPETSTGNVVYRSAVTLTNWGTVQRWDETTKLWTNYAGGYVSQDLSTGTFTVTAANGREGGVSTNAPRKFRLLEPTGITPAKPTDIIKDLNLRTLGTTYISDFYDLTEWANATATLVTIGVLFDKNIELNEAIRIIQNGSYPGFRYEINASGKRTARINDWTASATWNIPWVAIKDNFALKVSTDSKTFAAAVKVNYDKDYSTDGKYYSVTNTTYEAATLAKYRQKPQEEINSLVVSKTDADNQASWYAARLSEIRGIVSVKLHGQEYYTMRIYDIINIELCLGNRTYFGKWKAQVLSVNPKFDDLSNAITAVMIEQLEC